MNELSADPNLLRECRTAKDLYRGGDLLDIGAHHGLYSAALIPFARAEAKLISFEPDPEAYRLLQVNLASLASFFTKPKLLALPFPAGDGSTVAMAAPNQWHRAYHSEPNSDIGMGGARTLTVDGLVSAFSLNPDLIKIDVEGAELAVLKGARQTLLKHNCHLVLEVHPLWQPAGATPEQCHAILTELGYVGSLFQESEVVQRWAYHKM